MLQIVNLTDYFTFFFFNDTATTEIYTLSLHDALPISPVQRFRSDVPHEPTPLRRGDGLGGAGPDELGARPDGGEPRHRLADALFPAGRLRPAVRVQPRPAPDRTLPPVRPPPGVRPARAPRHDSAGAQHLAEAPEPAVRSAGPAVLRREGPLGAGGRPRRTPAAPRSRRPPSRVPRRPT